MANGGGPSSRSSSTPNYGVLEQRVYGTERKVDELSVKFGELSSQVSQQFGAMRSEVSRDIEIIGGKIDRQLTAGRANWTAIIASAVGIGGLLVSVFVVVGSMSLSPIRENQSDFKQAVQRLYDETLNKADFRDYVAGTDRWLGSLRDRLQTLPQEYVSQRQLTELKERFDERYQITTKFHDQRLDHEDARIGDLSANTPRRAEMTTAVDTLSARETSIIASLNELRHDLGSDFTLGDAVKELQRRISELQAQGNGTAISAARSRVTPGGE
jgi:hypothetical protein